MIPLAHQPDPYNYPMPQRKDLMSLSVIDQWKDGEYTQAKKFNTNRGFNQALKTSDIEGAQPKQFGSKVSKKEEFANQNWDIDRSGPRALHIGLNKPEYGLKNEDIEHSMPDCIKFKTMRSGDPLNPSYKLPEVEMKPVTPPKFIRDHINNDDIEGSKPKKPVYYQTRDNILKVEDIPGAKARDRTFTRTTQFDAINYRDVTHADFKSKRVTNPLEPTYVVRNEDGSTTTIGKIENSTSHKIPERKRGPLSSSLETSDIAGAQTGTKNLGVFATFKRKDYSKTNDISDIAGSTVGSLRKGPATKRISNPLNPDYQMPGGSEFKETNAFGNTGQQVVAGPQPISSQTRFAHRVKPPIAMPHNINREHFKRDRNQFYGEEDKNFADVDFNKLYKATKNPNPGAAPQMAPDLRDDVGFRRNEKKFYSQDQTDKSEFEYNQAKFYSGGAQNPAELDRARLENLGGHAKVQKPEVNTKAQHFKRDQAHFYGKSYAPSEGSSDMGSIYQNNAAEFHGLDKPTHGERPFQNPKQFTSQPSIPQQNAGSVLNERRLKEHESNMQRDPKFGKNLRKFWGMKSNPTNSAFSSSNKSYAQKLDGFIG